MTPTEIAEGRASWDILVACYGVIAYITAAACVAWAAEQRKRSHPNWFFLSLAITPAFTVILLVAAGTKEWKAKHTEPTD
jgi:hypothetical protein